MQGGAKVGLKLLVQPWLVWLSGLSVGTANQRVTFVFPVRARTWVASQVPSRGRMRGNHT